MKRILLVEPEYRNKYPPLGLMKISAYHKLRGDHVEFVKGRSRSHREYTWDRIYVASLFTFYWKVTIRTIEYYRQAVCTPQDIWVGGVLATLLADDVSSETGATVVRGLLDKPKILDSTTPQIVDYLIPDYSILDEIEYRYPTANAYIGYATRGCPNRCPFCAVPTLEPDFCHYTPLARQVRGIEQLYGPKKDLLLLDNNVLASREFRRIMHDILDLGFERGAKLNNQLRTVDFNQGLDARKVDRAKMKLLARTAIRPLRFALDTAGMLDAYAEAVHLACECGVPEIGTYVLFNYKDTPNSFYDRLRASVELNQRLGAKITSFPMRYIPLNEKHRTYVGPHWNRRLLRGIQCILLSTHGMVSPNKTFFEAAFGRDYDEFIQIVSMPEHYIINRRKHENNEASDWENLYRRLTRGQRESLYEILAEGKVKKCGIAKVSGKRLRDLLSHYIGETDKVKHKGAAKP
jgi:hypothetical protein